MLVEKLECNDGLCRRAVKTKEENANDKDNFLEEKFALLMGGGGGERGCASQIKRLMFVS